MNKPVYIDKPLSLIVREWLDANRPTSLAVYFAVRLLKEDLLKSALDIDAIIGIASRTCLETTLMERLKGYGLSEDDILADPDLSEFLSMAAQVEASLLSPDLSTAF